MGWYEKCIQAASICNILYWCTNAPIDQCINVPISRDSGSFKGLNNFMTNLGAELKASTLGVVKA